MSKGDDELGMQGDMDRVLEDVELDDDRKRTDGVVEVVESGDQLEGRVGVL